MSFTTSHRANAGRPCKANANMDILIANADSLITSTDFSGSRVYKNNQSITTATATAISFTAEFYDLGGWWAIGNPTRFTVPSGIAYAQLSFEVVWAADMIGTSLNEVVTALIYADKNGATFVGRPIQHLNRMDSMTVTSPILAVVATDYFEVKVQHATGTNKVISCVASIRGWA